MREGGEGEEETGEGGLGEREQAAASACCLSWHPLAPPGGDQAQEKP